VRQLGEDREQQGQQVRAGAEPDEEEQDRSVVDRQIGR